MQGIEIAEAYWRECGRPMLEREFPELMPLLAAGLCGPGSECFGFDDELSRDHDFAPGFCLFIPDETVISRETAFRLERAYAALPKEFGGLKRELFTAAGGERRGVLRTADFFERTTGLSTAPTEIRDYLAIPETAWAEAMNGRVFYDGPGDVTAIREAWRNPPRDICLKKLCGYLLLMSQAGEYNFPRCLARGDRGAAMLALNEYAHAALEAAAWSFNRPLPYYKWSFRFVKRLPGAESIASELEELLAGGLTETIERRMRSIDAEVIRLAAESAGERGEFDLQQLSRRLNDRISDNVLRTESPLAAVD